MKPGAAPSFIEPMMARLVERLPTGKWLYELKFDGYRALAFKTGQEVRLVSRNQVGFKYPQLANALKSLPAQNVIIDGEIAALDDEGRSSFQLLQGYGSGEQGPPSLAEALVRFGYASRMPTAAISTRSSSCSTQSAKER